jgi:hypothetical protein
MVAESWKDVPGYEGLYKVNLFGMVLSVGRVVLRNDGQPLSVREKFVTQPLTQKGYRRVSLSKNGARKTHRVHRLVAAAFVPNPNGKPQINHIDGNKSNNVVENLEWVDGFQNIQHSVELCTKYTMPVRCLSDGLVHKSLRRAAEFYGIGHSDISDVCHGKKYSVRGLRFEFVGRDTAIKEGLKR